MATQWQYEVVVLPIGVNTVKDILKKCGDNGWELISVVHQPSYKLQPEDSEHVAYFKKPRTQ